jgi:hypothetical protein
MQGRFTLVESTRPPSIQPPACGRSRATDYPLLPLPAAGDNAAMQTEPKPKRRWHEFSMRSLMIAVTLLCVVFFYVGTQAKIVSERRELLNWITQSGGKVYPLVSEQEDHWCRW